MAIGVELIKNTEKSIEEIDSMLSKMRWVPKDYSIYWGIKEIFDLYRLRIRNRLRVLYNSPRKQAVADFIDNLKRKKDGTQQNIQIRKNPYLYEYIKYYRCTFPEAMKPSDEMITLYTDGELNEDAIDNLKKLHDNKPEASLDSASLFFWNLTEWAGCADLSFLDERQCKIVINMLP